MKNNFISTIPDVSVPYKLPNNWKWFYWKDIMKSYQQGMIRSNKQLGSGNVEYLKMGDIDSNGSANLNELKLTFANEKEITDYELKDGDFLINVRNSLSLVGKTCVIDNTSEKIILYNHMLVRIDHGNIDLNYFVNAFLNIPSSKKLLDRIKEGTTTVIALYQRELNTLPIPLPDELTFTKIVNFYKRLRLKIELNNKINAELEAMAKTLYDYWFVQFDFPDKNGKPYKSSGGKMVYNKMLKREIPEGWEDGKFESIASIIGGSTPSKSNSDNFTEYKGTAWITPKDLSLNKGKKYITRGLLNVTKKGIKSASLNILPKDTVLLSSRAPIGYLAISRNELTTNQGFKSFVPKGEFKSSFIYYCVKNQLPKIEAYSSGSTFKEVSATTLKSIYISIPPKDILKEYYKFIEPIFQKQNVLELQNQKLTELRDWLLPMLMNGQVTVKEQKASVNLPFYQMQLLGLSIQANKKDGILQGEMAIAKDMYLLDRLYDFNTQMKFVNHSWGPYAPEIKKRIKIKQYFSKKNFPNSQAKYFDVKNENLLLGKVNSDTKNYVYEAIQDLNEKLFSKVSKYEIAEIKELLATVLKCIEDTQSIAIDKITKAMTNWKIKQGKYKNKAEKFTEIRTRKMLQFIVSNGWDKKVIN